MDNKQLLRKHIKQLRSTLDMESISSKICENLLLTSEYQISKNIMIYYPLKDEINILSLLQDRTKNFYLPKIEGNSLICCPFQEDDELCISSFKTKEPLTGSFDKNLIDLIIVPALCCDKNNYRLGYGGGFYDRFLHDYKGKTIVCLPKELVVDTIFAEPYDVPVSKVLIV